MKTVLKNEADNEVFEQNQFNISYIPERVGTFVIDILNAIEMAEQFSEAIKVLEVADENNSVRINLQCPGGSLNAADHFIHAMRKCKGHIHTVATGAVNSAATFILLESDSFELSENFHALLHCGSLGNIGNFNEYLSKAEFDAKFMRKVLTNTYAGFLSFQEIESLLKGEDIWLDAEQWMTRFEKREQWRAKLAGIDLADFEEDAKSPKKRKQIKEKDCSLDE